MVDRAGALGDQSQNPPIPRNSMIASQKPRKFALNLHFVRAVELGFVRAVCRVKTDHAVLTAEILEGRLLVADQRDYDLLPARIEELLSQIARDEAAQIRAAQKELGDIETLAAKLGGQLELNVSQLMADMDAWGYTYRLGSTRAWFEGDAEDARAWLVERGLLVG